MTETLAQARLVRAGELDRTPLAQVGAGFAHPLPLSSYRIVVGSLDGVDCSIALGRRGWVEGVYTLPEYRSRGAGYAALEMLIREWPHAACQSGTSAGERLVARLGIRDLTLTPTRG